MKPCVAIVLLMLTGNACVSGQFAYVPTTARHASLGGVQLPDTTMRRIAIGYRQGYGLVGMATRFVDASWNLGGRGRVEMGYSHLGDRIYHEQQATAGYYIKISDWLSTGISAHYFRFATDDAHYEAQQWLTAEATVMALLSSRVTVYAKGGSRTWDTSKAWRGCIGLVYSAVEGLVSVVEMDSEQWVRLRMGVEYCYRRHYFVRAGMASRPTTLTFGLGTRWSSYGIDLAVEYHEYLGITPQISLSVCP